jgi:O-antigen ligase
MSINIAEEFASFKKAGTSPKINFLEIFYTVCLAVVIFPVLSSADSYLHEEGLLPIPFPSFFLLIALFTPVFLKSLSKNSGQDLLAIYQKTARVTVPFGVIALISLVWGLHPKADWVNNGKMIYFNAYHFILLLFCIGLTSSQTMQKYYRPVILISLIGTCISVGVDVMHPKTFSDLEARAAGFIGNSNEGALTVLFLTICTIDWNKNSFLNMFALSIAGMAIFTTLSIGTLYLYAIVLVIYIALIMKKSSITKNMVFVLTLSALTIFVVIPTGMSLIENSKMFSFHDAKERIKKVVNMGQGNYDFAKDHERIKMISLYFELIMEAPLLGHGTGYKPSTETEAHNLYLRKWTENGILGLAAYLSLLAFSFYHFMVLRDTRGMLFIFVISGAGFFDHSLLNHRTLIGLLGIMGTLAYLEHSNAPERALQKAQLSR